jgi:enoyl-CoA hydratase
MSGGVGSAADRPLQVEVAGGVATVRLDRPSSRNALSHALLTSLRQAMAEVGDREDVGAVILTGSDPAFCAGLDLKELSAETRLLDAGDPGVPPWSPWKPLAKPLIGAINGAAITGGLELALHCDFLIASERAVFADTHARVGILPGWGLSVLLPQRVGFAMARRMSFTGDFVDARTALAAGLVTEVVAHDELLPTAQRLAATIVANHRPAVRALHASYRRIEHAGAAEAFELEQEAAREWRRSGASDGIAARVPGVIARGRDQASSAGPA